MSDVKSNVHGFTIRRGPKIVGGYRCSNTAFHLKEAMVRKCLNENSKVFVEDPAKEYDNLRSALE